MLIKKIDGGQASESDVTAEETYSQFRRDRRRFLMGTAGLFAAAMLPAEVRASESTMPSHYAGVTPAKPPGWLSSKIQSAQWQAIKASPSDVITPFNDATNYNNFYEFGTDKTDPAANSAGLVTDPWSVIVDGEVEKPIKLSLEDLIGPSRLQERIYRLRCVEAWSMVIPWLGIPLSDILKRIQPTSKARYVQFESLEDPAQMPGQQSNTSLIQWPYREGLRMDEAMHPLTFMAVGMYGRELANQNGAPLRLVVPWKYGFKSAKSIVRITLMEQQPVTSWERIAPDVYGFYSNVNPTVDMTPWSQAEERRLPNSLFHPNIIATQMFNGYGEQVADLYKGMNLSRDF